MIDYYKKYIKYKQKYIQKKQKKIKYRGGYGNGWILDFINQSRNDKNESLLGKNDAVLNYFKSKSNYLHHPTNDLNWLQFLAYKDTIHDFFKDRGTFSSPISGGYENIKDLINNEYNTSIGNYLCSVYPPYSSVEEKTEKIFLDEHTEIKKYTNQKELLINDLEETTLNELKQIQQLEFGGDICNYDTIKITLGDAVKSKMKDEPFNKIIKDIGSQEIKRLYEILNDIITKIFDLKYEMDNTISVDANQSYLHYIFKHFNNPDTEGYNTFSRLNTVTIRGDSAFGASEDTKTAFPPYKFIENKETCFPIMKKVTCLPPETIYVYQFSSNIFTYNDLYLFYFMETEEYLGDKSDFYFLVLHKDDIDVLPESGEVGMIKKQKEELMRLENGYAVKFVKQPWGGGGQRVALKTGLSVSHLSEIIGKIHDIDINEPREEDDLLEVRKLFKPDSKLSPSPLLYDQLCIYYIIKRLYISLKKSKDEIIKFLFDYKRGGDYEQVNSVKYIMEKSCVTTNEDKKKPNVILTTGDRLCSLYSRLRQVNTIYTTPSPYTMYFYRGKSIPLKFINVWNQIENEYKQMTKTFPAPEDPPIINNYISLLNESFKDGYKLWNIIQNIETKPAFNKKESTDRLIYLKSWGTSGAWVNGKGASQAVKALVKGWSGVTGRVLFYGWVDPTYSPILKIYENVFTLMYKLGPNQFAKNNKKIKQLEIKLEYLRNKISKDIKTWRKDRSTNIESQNWLYKTEYNEDKNIKTGSEEGELTYTVTWLVKYFEEKQKYNKMYNDLIKLNKKLNILNIDPVSHIKSSYCQYPLLILIKYYFKDIFEDKGIPKIYENLIDFPPQFTEGRGPGKFDLSKMKIFNEHSPDYPNIQYCINDLLTYFILLLENLEDFEKINNTEEFMFLKDLLKNSSLIYLKYKNSEEIIEEGLTKEYLQNIDTVIKKSDFINKEFDPQEETINTGPRRFTMKYVSAEEKIYYIKLMSNNYYTNDWTRTSLKEASTGEINNVGILNILESTLTKLLNELTNSATSYSPTSCSIIGGAQGSAELPERAEPGVQSSDETKITTFFINIQKIHEEREENYYPVKHYSVRVNQDDPGGENNDHSAALIQKISPDENEWNSTLNDWDNEWKIPLSNPEFNMEKIISLCKIKDLLNLSITNILYDYYNIFDDILNTIKKYTYEKIKSYKNEKIKSYKNEKIKSYKKNDNGLSESLETLSLQDTQINDKENVELTDMIYNIGGRIVKSNFYKLNEYYDSRAYVMNQLGDSLESVVGNIELKPTFTDFKLLLLVFTPFDIISEILFPVIRKIKKLIKNKFTNRSSENYKMLKYMNYKENIELIIIQYIIQGDYKFENIEKILDMYYKTIYHLLNPKLHINLAGGLIFAVLSADIYQQYLDGLINDEYELNKILKDEDHKKICMNFKKLIKKYNNKYINWNRNPEMLNIVTGREQEIYKKIVLTIKNKKIKDLLREEFETIGDFDTKISMKLPENEIDDALKDKASEESAEFLLGRLKMGHVLNEGKSKQLHGEQIDIGYSILNNNELSKLIHSNIPDFEKLLIELVSIIINNIDDPKIDKRIRRFIILDFIKENKILGEGQFEKTTILKELHNIILKKNKPIKNPIDSILFNNNLVEEVIEDYKTQQINLIKNIDPLLFLPHNQYPQIYNPKTDNTKIKKKYDSSSAEKIINFLTQTKKLIKTQTTINILALLQVDPQDIPYRTLATNLYNLLIYMQDNISINLYEYNEQKLPPLLPNRGSGGWVRYQNGAFYHTMGDYSQWDEPENYEKKFEDLNALKLYEPEYKMFNILLVSTLLEDLLCNSYIVNKWHKKLTSIYNTKTKPLQKLSEWIHPSLPIEWDIFDGPTREQKMSSEAEAEDEEKEEEISSITEWNKEMNYNESAWNSDEKRAKRPALMSLNNWKPEIYNEIKQILAQEKNFCKDERDGVRITMNNIKITQSEKGEWL